MPSFTVFDASTNMDVCLTVSDADYQRAMADNTFLVALVNQEYSRRAEAIAAAADADEAEAATEDAHAPSDEAQEEQEVQEGGDQKSIFLWTTDVIYLLLSLYEENMEQFSAGKKTHKKIWAGIAAEVKLKSGKDPKGEQCQSKMASLKKTYKNIIDHNGVSGNNRKTWPYFKRMDEIFGKSGWAEPKALATEAGPGPGPGSSAASASDSPPVAKKARAEVLLDKFVEELRRERKEREEAKRREKEAKEAAFQKLQMERKSLKEQMHRETMEMMRKMTEAITGKKIDN
ncbi:uncharacterized protein LOC117653733 [Thrips palmi]|uniref:Uncharacterized protein LOC117653733 n=1 Tax=Thrips palmi TaxID=161013 RepID=A0A6P9AD98_THRPL|nr:uncharacterized protein LOC117653733 [Thrips palmi]XP_034255481.1 uncharacterized protein LOC117653733 [Thrips palmi]